VNQNKEQRKEEHEKKIVFIPDWATQPAHARYTGAESSIRAVICATSFFPMKETVFNKERKGK